MQDSERAARDSLKLRVGVLTWATKSGGDEYFRTGPNRVGPSKISTHLPLHSKKQCERIGCFVSPAPRNEVAMKNKEIPILPSVLISIEGITEEDAQSLINKICEEHGCDLGVKIPLTCDDVWEFIHCQDQNVRYVVEICGKTVLCFSKDYREIGTEIRGRGGLCLDLRVLILPDETAYGFQDDALERTNKIAEEFDRDPGQLMIVPQRSLLKKFKTDLVGKAEELINNKLLEFHSSDMLDHLKQSGH